MAQPELALSAYLRLAVVSHEHGQHIPRNKFLILAGNSACLAGLLEIAARCRELIVTQNPRHLLGQYTTFPDALRSEEFQTYLRQVVKFCTVERAEHLLTGMQETVEPATDESARTMLAQMSAP